VGESRRFPKGDGAGEFPGADVQASEGGAAQERGGEREVERPRTIDKGQFLDALVGEPLQPFLDLPLVHVQVAASDLDAAERARVRVEDSVHRVVDAERALGERPPGQVLPALRKEASVGEDEGHRTPDAAPARGERAGAHGVLGSEAGDDVPQDLVGKAADAVDAVLGCP
jgi:hypothetical protein